MAQIHPIFITQQLYNDILMVFVLFRVFVNMEIFFKILIGRKN